MNDNELTVEVFEQYSTTQVQDPAGDLGVATIEHFETVYPGGLYGSSVLSIPRDVTRFFPFRGGQRLTIYSGLDVVYEGEITNPVFSVGESDQGVEIECRGHWGTLMGKILLDKPWSDNRYTPEVWIYDETTSAGNKCKVDRQDRVKLTPEGIAWTSGEYAQVTYTAPVGQTIKKITYDCELQEGGQAWEAAWYDATNGKVSIRTTSGTSSSQTYTPATPVQSISFRLYAGANQTPDGFSTYYTILGNMAVWTETSNINLYEIALDVRAAASNLNSDVTNIASGATLAIQPFVTNGPKTLSSILNFAASFGDSSGNSYAAYLREQSFAATPDGKPVLVVEQYPALTSYDYAVRIDEQNVTGSFRVIWDFDNIVNYVIVQYRDANGKTSYVTPADDATLTDATSVAAWGTRMNERPLNAGDTTQANAIAYGVRFLAYYKNPLFSVSGPISVVGTIRTNGQGDLPVCQARAGKRLKIENWLEDLAQVSGAGLTFIITRTQYNPATETVSIYTGSRPDDLGIWLAQQQDINKYANIVS